MKTTKTKDGEVIEINEKGGAGSSIPYWELLDFRALDLIAERATKGAKKYARNNWRAVPWQEHIRHAVRHAYGALEPEQQEAGDFGYEQSRDELSGFICRAMMAVAVFLQDDGVEELVPTGLAFEAEAEAEVDEPAKTEANDADDEA